MAGLVQNILDGYNYLFDELPNPITKNWFLVARPFQIVGLVAFYFFFSTRLGPWYMKNRKPYNLKNVIKYYNIFQVLASSYLFVEGCIYIFSKEFSILCQNVDDPSTPRARHMAKVGYFYFIIKVVDLLDTVFFVLRKSDRQITPLHLHHHTLMPLVTWIAITYFPGGQTVITGCVNAFVHAVMYGYYFLAGLGDQYKKFLWWKRHVTELQLAQFILIGLHAFNSLFYECGYPLWIKCVMIIYAGIFINMFGQFYYNCYIVRKPRQNVKDKRDKERQNNGLEANEGSAAHKNEKETHGDMSKTTYRNFKVSNGLQDNIRGR